MTVNQIIKLIEDKSEKYGFTPSTICQYAGCSGLLYESLKNGGTCMLATLEKLKAYNGWGYKGKKK